VKVAFVVPWYGEYAVGGAESEAKRTVEKLNAAGIETEVLTTCVRGHDYPWDENFYKEGVYEENGVTVRRFRTDRVNKPLFDAVNFKLMNRLPIYKTDEEVFVRESIGSRRLYRYIRKHSQEYIFFFIPYLFGTTYWGSQIVPDRSILIPCLHDESYAHMNAFKEMFLRVRGIVFHTAAEMELARRLYGISDDKAFLIGEGIDTDFGYDGDRFRRRYGIDYPFMLYVGRKVEGKNVYLLLEYFLEYKRRNPSDLRLVFIGPGEVRFDRWGDVVDLGFVSLQDKYDAYSAAEFLCQPSVNESFSIVVMESWVVGRPVLVHGGCRVTRGHCEESGGGLWFSGYGEFEEVVNYMLSHREEVREMGRRGREYVLRNYRWEVVVEKYKKVIERF